MDARTRSERDGGDGGKKEKKGPEAPHLAGVADVSQSGSAGFSRSGVPGNNTCRVRGTESQRTAARQKGFFSSPEAVIEGIMNQAWIKD